ncbi:MAG: HAD-IA family hydrolase [Coriobacteriia bacterium]|nr:HAD-IA family hydrolase [Coriobacteriia bacterium]
MAPGPSPAERLAELQGVLFDLDGTLINTVSLILSSFRYATERVLGQALPDPVLMRNVGVPLIDQMREFDPERADELLRVYREHNAAHHDEMVVEYPGTEETLEWLRARRYPLAVVTSKGTPMTIRGLQRFGLERFFDVVVTADDVPEHKPDPHPVEHAAKLLDVDVTRSVYVGDSPHDMAAGIGAGAISTAALWGAFASEDVLEPGPDYALRSMKDLPEMLSGGEARFRNGW